MHSIAKAIRGKILSSVCVAIDVAASEELPTIEMLCEIAASLKVPVYWWDLSMGFQHVLFSPGVGIQLVSSKELVAEDAGWAGRTLDDKGCKKGSPIEELGFIRRFPGGDKQSDGLFVCPDLHKLMTGGPSMVATQRAVKTMLAALSSTRNTRLVMIGQDIELPTDFTGIIDRFIIPSPNEAERLEEIQKWIPLLRSDLSDLRVPKATDSVWERLKTSSATLTLKQVGNAVREVAATHRCIGEETAIKFHELKIGNLMATGIRVAPAPTVELGGFGVFRRWIEDAVGHFDLNDPDVPAPKGCVLFGLPGTGKSLAAKIAGQVLGVSVMEITPDLFLGGVVGQSEHKTRVLLRRLSEAAPAVVWFDEIEKLFGGMADGGNDGGAGQRVFGQVLNFLQENTTSLFFVATANRIDGLPPELLRPGRFDRVFWAGMPHGSDREEILTIHLKRWGRKMSPEAIAEAADIIALSSDGFSGAELAAIVERAAVDAYSVGSKGDIALADLQRHRSMITPQSQTDSGRFAALTEQAKLFCPASLPNPGKAGVSLGRVGSVDIVL